MTIQTLSSKLQTAPDSLSWSEKAAAAAMLTAGLGWKDKLPAQAATALSILAADPKWEVRKAVADVLHLIPDSHFAELAAMLGGDSHHFVQGAAQKAVERRSKAQVDRRRQGRGLKKADSEIEKIARKHGDTVATAVRDQAVRLFEGLVGSSVHELRNILGALRGDLDNMVREEKAGKAREAVTRYAPRLKDTLQFMEHLLEDMRSYTEFTQEHKHTEILAELVQSAVDMVQAGFAGTGRPVDGIKLTLNVPAGLALPAARKQIVLAFRNLIKNAYEAVLEQDAGSGNVTVSASRNDSVYEINISDTGIGLDEDELMAVRRLIPGNSSKENGTGYGLPIAQRYLAFHGGSLEIHSKDGKGTMVVVRLPAEHLE